MSKSQKCYKGNRYKATINKLKREKLMLSTKYKLAVARQNYTQNAFILRNKEALLYMDKAYTLTKEIHNIKMAGIAIVFLAMLVVFSLTIMLIK